MSLDPSLKDRNRLSGRRNVLTRPERIAKMEEEGRFDSEEDSPFGLPKYRVIQSKAGSKKKAEKAEGVPVDADGAVEGAEGAAEGEETPQTESEE
jgi:small basic protein (TIGR04137 family)